MSRVFVAITGLASGIMVGSGIVALITLLDIVPRVAQLSKTQDKIRLYEGLIILGATLASFLSLSEITIGIPKVVVAIIGFFIGCFVGLLASALAEVMNVIPVVIRRFRLEGYVRVILYALIFGKVLGSLYQWILLE